MVKVANYVAHLGPLEGTNSKGTGTAIFSETYLPGGRVSVFYALTVAGTSGAPTNAALFSRSVAFAPQLALPKLELRFSRDKSTGGTLSGSYDTNGAAEDALLASHVVARGGGAVALVVTTSAFPKGELYGNLELVR
jgi:hypothetical protein